METLRKCVNIMKEKVDPDFEFHSLGTPQNLKTDDTLDALEQFPQFKTLMMGGTPPVTGRKFMHLTNNATLFESGTGILRDLETLKQSYISSVNNPDSPYIIYQGHPANWDGNDRQDTEIFKQFVAWLRTQNAVFMTPTQYYDFVE